MNKQHCEKRETDVENEEKGTKTKWGEQQRDYAGEIHDGSLQCFYFDQFLLYNFFSQFCFYQQCENNRWRIKSVPSKQTEMEKN